MPLFADQAAAVLEPLLAAGLFDKDAAHGRGGGGKEVGAAVPALGCTYLGQAQVGLMDQRCGLQCLSGLFLGELLRRQVAQLVIDKR
jgi:hypothetical protein